MSVRITTATDDELPALRQELRVLVRGHAHFKRLVVSFGNQLKVKADGKAQKIPDGQVYGLPTPVREFLEESLKNANAMLMSYEKQIRGVVHQLPIWAKHYKKASGVKELTLGYLEANVDLDPPRHPDKREGPTDASGIVRMSRVCRFTGYGEPGERPTAGKKRGYVKALKVQLFATGLSIMQSRNVCPTKYGAIYDARRSVTSVSERIVTERLAGGATKQVAWKDASAGHQHQDAIRVMVREIVKDYVRIRAAIEGRAI